MKSCFSRTVTAIGLGVSLWFTTIAAMADPVQAQDQPQSQKQSAPQQTVPEYQKSQGGDHQQTASQPSTKKALQTSEDQTMIGKRNINKGIWSGGILGAKGIESEVRLGRQLAAEVDKEAKFVDDPIITEYVNRVGQNIVLHSDAKVPFTIKVIDSDEVNAFALPGGFFYVNKGLILAADNEAELAGVMAHEIAHVCARHAMENEAKLRALNIWMLAGILFGGPILGKVLYNGRGVFVSNALPECNP